MDRDAILIEFYKAAQQRVDGASQRLWQVAAALGAVVAVGSFLLAAIVPQDEFRAWAKVAAVWTSVAAVLVIGAIGAFVFRFEIKAIELSLQTMSAIQLQLDQPHQLQVPNTAGELLSSWLARHVYCLLALFAVLLALLVVGAAIAATVHLIWTPVATVSEGLTPALGSP